MSSGKLIKLLVPTVRQVTETINKAGTVGARYQTGQCGINPYKPAPPPPPPIPEKFPDHLLRPPCIPGGEKARFPPDCAGLQGFYCPPQRIQFKYPPFSDNIDFVPSGEVECWWAKPRVCTFNDEDEDLPIKVT